MPERLPRYRTGDAGLDQALVDLLDQVGADHDRDQLFEIMVSALRLATDKADRLDLKIVNAALKEMRSAFRAFSPIRDIPKVTIFGSARTRPEDPLYDQTRELARLLAEKGWMVVTGAGPGIMAAGLEGAGREHAFGVNIRLPTEQEPSDLLDPERLISMKYFFTRKLMLMKESQGFVAMPGGFGTLDEAFELLTLAQTGKADPRPVVLLEVPDGSYWRSWEKFLIDEVASRGLISADDGALYRITDDVAEAETEIRGFYRNYHSLRFVGDRLVLRLRAAPTAEEVVRLNAEFGDICSSGGIEATPPLAAEVSDRDKLDLPRLVFLFDRWHYARLRQLIDAINQLDSAPPLDP